MINKITESFSKKKARKNMSPVDRDLLIDNMNDGILVLDDQGIVLDVNQATLILTGLKEDDLLGRLAPKEFRSSMERLPSDPEATRARIEVKWETPLLRYLDLSVSPIHDKNGKLLRRLLVLRDITKQKQVEKTLRLYNNRLNILHDIDKGILSAISLEEAAHNTLAQLQKIFSCEELSLMEYDTFNNPRLLAEIRPGDHKSGVLNNHLPGIDTLNATLFQGKIVTENPFATMNGTSAPEKTASGPMLVRAPLRGPSIPRKNETGELNIQSGLIGLITLVFTASTGLTDSDMELLREISHELSATLQNARLQQETRRRALQLQVASEIARDIADAREPRDLINRTVSFVRSRFNYYHVGIYLLDEKGEFAALQAATGEPGEKMLMHEHKFKVGGMSLVGKVAERGVAQIAQNMDAEKTHLKNPYLPNTRSELALPLRKGGHVIGVLDVHCEDVAAYEQEDAMTLQILADQLAIALENARLNQMAQQRLDETVRQVGELAVLYAIAQAGALSSTEDALIERATEVIGENFYPDNFGILLVDEEEKVVITHPSYRGVQSTNRLGAGITGRVAADGRPRLVADVAASSGYLRLDSESRSEICVPIKIEDKVIGVINAESRQINAFNLNDERLLNTVAELLATAIQKNRLHQDLKKHAQDLALALEKQQELDRLKSQFIQNVSHELRTPLAIIRGYAEILDSGDLGELDVAYKEPVSTIARRASMLSNMVDDLIAILEAEERKLKMEDFDMGNLITTMMGEFQMPAEKAGIALAVNVAPGLPLLHGDPNHIRRVVDNLVSNSLKFTPKNGQVKVAFYLEEDDFILKISDTGIGIPENELQRIFERFYQVDGSMSRRYGGTGLGLSLVHEIVTAHHGRIEVDSQPGQGTTFTIRLPAHPQYKAPALLEIPEGNASN